MRSFALNQFNDPKINSGFNDWYLDDTGNIATVDKINELIQSINCAIWMVYGEYDFDTTIGIPYNKLLGQRPLDKTLLIYHIKKAILDLNKYIVEAEKSLYTIQNDIYIDIKIDDTSRIATTTIYLQLKNNTSIKYSINNYTKQIFNLRIE